MLKISQGQDGQGVQQVAASPEVLFRRVVAPKGADGGKVHREYDPADERRRRVALKRKREQGIGNDDGRPGRNRGFRLRQVTNELVEGLLLLEIHVADHRLSREKPRKNKEEHYGAGVREIAKQP